MRNLKKLETHLLPYRGLRLTRGDKKDKGDKGDKRGKGESFSLVLANQEMRQPVGVFLSWSKFWAVSFTGLGVEAP
jgi:hypothetical protein